MRDTYTVHPENLIVAVRYYRALDQTGRHDRAHEIRDVIAALVGADALADALTELQGRGE